MAVETTAKLGSHFDFIDPVEQLAERQEKPSSSNTKEFKVITYFPRHGSVMRVSMGLTDGSKAAKNLVDSRK